MPTSGIFSTLRWTFTALLSVFSTSKNWISSIFWVKQQLSIRSDLEATDHPEISCCWVTSGCCLMRCLLEEEAVWNIFLLDGIPLLALCYTFCGPRQHSHSTTVDIHCAYIIAGTKQGGLANNSPLSLSFNSIKYVINSWFRSDTSWSMHDPTSYSKS